MLVQWLGWEDMTPMNVGLLFVSEERWQLLVFVGVLVLLAPLGEELFFRGLVYRNLREWWSSGEAGLASGLIFGFIHLDPTTVFPLVVVGYLFARSYERTGSLVVVVAMHAVHNGISLLFIFTLV
jgi:membrane protease YdiL (CAAX protease family)